MRTFLALLVFTSTLSTSVAGTPSDATAIYYPRGTVDSFEPSGLAPPGPDSLRGFTQSYVQDFLGSSIPAGWNPYPGQPGGDLGAQFAPTHDVVSNGILSLNTFRDGAYNNRWVTGGICDCAVSSVYGASFVRSRVSGPGPTNVELLWPSTKAWPPEIDFNETLGVTNGTSATVHWRTSKKPHLQDQRWAVLDMTQWHTFGVIWTPSRITFAVDGVAWGVVTNKHEIPSIAMHLSLQQQTWCHSGWACPSSNQSLQIDWVADYVMGSRPATALKTGRTLLGRHVALDLENVRLSSSQASLRWRVGGEVRTIKALVATDPLCVHVVHTQSVPNSLDQLINHVVHFSSGPSGVARIGSFNPKRIYFVKVVAALKPRGVVQSRCLMLGRG